MFKAIRLPSDEPVQYIGVYVLQWGKTDEPTMGFVEVDEDALRDALEDILAEARSSLPVDGLYADMAQFYREKVNRIAAMADAALSREEVIG